MLSFFECPDHCDIVLSDLKRFAIDVLVHSFENYQMRPSRIAYCIIVAAITTSACSSSFKMDSHFHGSNGNAESKFAISQKRPMECDLPTCMDNAINTLKDKDPTGLFIYQTFNNRRAFACLLKCNEKDFALPAAIHETSYLLASYDSKTYYLVLANGEKAGMKDIGGFPLSEAINQLDSEELKHNPESLLHGLNSPDKGFEILMYEMEGYASEVSTAHHLYGLIPYKGPTQENAAREYRDHTATIMLILEKYLKRAREKHPDFYSDLVKEPSVADTIGKVWNHAEAALKEACTDPMVGVRDWQILQKVYTVENEKELADFFAGGKHLFTPHPPGACASFVVPPPK